MSTWVIVLACGKEQEIASGVDVAFLALGNRPVLAHSLQTLEQNPLIDGIVMAVKKERIDSTLQMIRQFGCRKVSAIVAGGAQRQANLKKAYDQIPEDALTILVHESSRPFVSDTVITETIKAGKRYGAAVAAVKSADPVKLAEKGQRLSKTLDRSTIWLAQSPQVFKRDVFEKVLKGSGKLVDDESALLEKTRQPIHLVVSTSANMKIRTAADLEAAGALAGS